MPMLGNPENHKKLIVEKAIQLGFQGVYVAKARQLDDDARRLEQWLQKGFHANMGYMERNFDLRIDPRKLVPGAKSVISFLVNYYPSGKQSPDAPKVARYAWGTDYHIVVKEKLNQLLGFIAENIGAVEGRGFVDSAPVLERSWAVNSGAGWVGKNGNLINKQAGSYFFLATLISDLDLPPDPPFATYHCGTCTRCIDACPTEAIHKNSEIDANKCISYLTIELKDQIIPGEFKEKMEGWLFGCDICQEVCPWNRFSKPHAEPAFQPIGEILNLTTREWEAMTEEAFKKIFKHSPLKRAKWSGIHRNISFIKSL